MSITRTRTTLVTLVLLTACAATAFAQGRRAPSPPRGGGVTHSRGVLGQLVFPCAAACAADGHECAMAANDDAVACISAACATEVAAAQEACADDRRSETCKTAVAALATCADGCLDTYASTARACRSAQMDCREACAAE